MHNVLYVYAWIILYKIEFIYIMYFSAMYKKYYIDLISLPRTSLSVRVDSKIRNLYRWILKTKVVDAYVVAQKIAFVVQRPIYSEEIEFDDALEMVNAVRGDNERENLPIMRFYKRQLHRPTVGPRYVYIFIEKNVDSNTYTINDQYGRYSVPSENIKAEIVRLATTAPTQMQMLGNWIVGEFGLMPQISSDGVIRLEAPYVSSELDDVYHTAYMRRVMINDELERANERAMSSDMNSGEFDEYRDYVEKLEAISVELDELIWVNRPGRNITEVITIRYVEEWEWEMTNANGVDSFRLGELKSFFRGRFTTGRWTGTRFM